MNNNIRFMKKLSHKEIGVGPFFILKKQAKGGVRNLIQENQEKKSPLKAIREKCVDCCGGSVYEVKLCQVTKCTLHPFRFGKNPFYHRELTDEQRKAIGERLHKKNVD